MNIDTLWRKNFRKFLPNRNDLKCLDLASGTGDVAIELVKDFKVKHVRGTDMSKEMIKYGKERVEKLNLSKKITMVVEDGVIIPAKDNSYDVVTVSFGIRNFYDYREGLKNMARVVKPDGIVMILEFSLPKNKLLRSGYLFYFRKVLPKIGNKLSGHKFAYSYLNQTVEEFPYGQKFVKEMKNAGFKNVEIKTLSFGIASFYVGTK